MPIIFNRFNFLQTKSRQFVIFVMMTFPIFAFTQLAEQKEVDVFKFSADEINEYFTEEMGLTYQKHIANENTHTLVFSNEEDDFTSFLMVDVIFNSDYSSIISLAFLTGSKELYSAFMKEILKQKETEECKHEVIKGSETFIFSKKLVQFTKEFDVERGKTIYTIVIREISKTTPEALEKSNSAPDFESMFNYNLERINEVMTSTLGLSNLQTDQKSEDSDLVSYNNWNWNWSKDYVQILIKFSKGFSNVIEFRYVARDNKLFKNLKTDLLKRGYVMSELDNKEYYINLKFVYIFETIIQDNIFAYQITITKMK